MKNEQKEIDKNLKLIVKSSLIVLIGLFLSKVFTYLYRIIIARNFGPEVYGLFSLATMVLGFFIALSSVGFGEGILRFVSQYRGRKEYSKIKFMIKFSSIILVFTGIVSSILLFYFAEFISLTIFNEPRLIIFLKIFSLLIPFRIFSSILLSILKSFGHVTAYSFITNIFSKFLHLLFLILFIFMGFQINSIIFSYVLGFVLVFIASFAFFKFKIAPKLKGKKLPEKQKTKIRSALFSYSWPIMFSGIVAFIFAWIDSFSIGYFLDVAQVGFYNAALPIAYLLAFAPEIFMQMFFPLINKEFSRKKDKVVMELSKQVSKWIFLINLPIFFILLIFPGAIINILFGETYLVAENSLRVLAIAYFFFSVFSVPQKLILMKGKSKIILFDLIFTSIINILLNIILVPKFGMIGAAISTSFSWIILGFLWFFQAKKYVGIIPFRRKMITIFFVSLIPFFTLVVLSNYLPKTMLSLIFTGIFFFLFYLVLILITKCFDKNDIFIAKTILNKLNITKY